MCDEHSEVIEVCVDAVRTSEFSNSAIELVRAIVRIFLQKKQDRFKTGVGERGRKLCREALYVCKFKAV